MTIQINLLTAAIVVAVIGVMALGIYIGREISRAGNEGYNPEWMDYDKWRDSR